MSNETAETPSPSEDDPVPGEGDPAAVAPKGGGEWPSPETPPSPAAPGSDPEHAAELQDEREERTADDGTSSSELHPPSLRPSVYDERPDDAAVGSSAALAAPAAGERDAEPEDVPEAADEQPDSS